MSLGRRLRRRAWTIVKLAVASYVAYALGTSCNDYVFRRAQLERLERLYTPVGSVERIAESYVSIPLSSQNERLYDVRGSGSSYLPASFGLSSLAAEDYCLVSQTSEGALDRSLGDFINENDGFIEEGFGF